MDRLLTIKGAAAPHDCRPEPHCICGHNSWFHRDEYPHSCGADGCSCAQYVLCTLTKYSPTFSQKGTNHA